MNRHDRRPSEVGSVLMLVPTAILVLLVLGAIAVDSSVMLLAQRDLVNRTAAAANDIAGLGIDESAFYTGKGLVAVDRRRADAYVAMIFADDRRPAGYRSWSGAAMTDGRSVTVFARAEVDFVFARAIPGVAHSSTVEARSVVSLRGG